LQTRSQTNRNNLQNIRCETSITFRKKEREYLKGKINELKTNNKIRNIRDFHRGINEFKKGYQRRIIIIKDENGNMLAHSQSVLNRWKDPFNQVLNIHGVYDVRQKDIHTAEPSIPEPSLSKTKLLLES
jgi:hypothetical protein